MASPLVTKIVLKNTTKMSLHERFTAYRAEAQNHANSYRQKIQMQRQASSANLRLAQQMANRPTVIAALRIKKKSMQQRLGRQQGSTNVKARLNFSAKQMNGSSSIQGRLGTFRGRNFGRGGRGGFKPGTSPLVKARLGVPRQGAAGGFNFGAGSAQYQRVRGNDNRRGGFRSRNRRTRGGGGGGGNRAQQARGYRGGRRGGGGRWPSNPNLTKQDLDNQLDAYMAETKSSLDAQLGQYMQQG